MKKAILLVSKSTIVLLLLVTISLFSCQHYDKYAIKGSGNVVTISRQVSENFSRIEVSNALKVILEQSNDTQIIVEADDNLQNSIVTKIENGTLYIGRDNGNFRSNKPQKVYVKTPIIEEIYANSASSIKTNNTLKGVNITLKTTSAAKIEAQLAFENITASCSSASKINIEGMALNLDVKTDSAGKIEASNLLANNVTAESSSGSKMSIHPIISLKANANSGSKIEYNNNPKQTEKTSSSGGSIELK